MEAEYLSKEASVKITLGHLLLVWQVMSEKFSDLKSHDDLSEEEKRAIWGLADLLEATLVENGVVGKPQAEWEALIDSARRFMKTIPVDFLG